MLYEDTGEVDISIHAPRVGSDAGVDGLPGAHGHFNPRSPCGERRRCSEAKNENSKFQSTLPVWGATMYTAYDTMDDYISIHAPRVGSDVPFVPMACPDTDFNPRSPCGERPNL